jgi:predicted Zn-dependent protease
VAAAALGNVGTARDLVLALLRARPDDIAVLSALAALAVRGNPVDAAALTEARTRTEAALRARPNDLRLNLLMARVLVAGGARKAAIERLDAFRKTEAGGAGVDVPLALADLCRQEGDARSAALVDEAARIAPEDLRVLAGLAAEGKFDQVQRTAEAWRGQASKSGLLLTAAGILAAGDQPAPRKAAVDLYQEVTALVPASLPANLGLALASYQMGDADRAEKGYRKVLELDPENVRALNDLAWLLTESRQKHKEALDLADRGVLLAPRNSYLRDTRGVIFMRLGRMAEAQRDLEQCVALRSADPAGHARALLKLGRICHELNDPAATRRNLEQALQIDKEAQVLTPEDRQEIAQLLAAGSGGR